MTVTKLPTSSTERLMRVADVIEFRPKLYNQETWWIERPDGYATSAPQSPAPVYARATSIEPECHTVGCIAGWAVALTPISLLTSSWPKAGAEALGLSHQLAGYLFSAHFEAPPHVVADMLRRIARLPEGERNLSNMPLVLDDDQLRLLFGIHVSTYVEPDEDDEDDEDDDVVAFPPIEPTPDEGAPEEPSYGNGAHPDAPVLTLV